VPIEGHRACPEASDFSKEDIEQLVKRGTLVPIAPEDVKGACKMFGVYEIHKNRIRVIKWPRTMNNHFGAEVIDPDMNIYGKKQILDIIMRGEYYWDCDASIFFDQFAIHPDIGAYMCCKHDERYYRVGTGPMGQRQMVQVAQRSMQKLAAAPGRRGVYGVTVDNCINVNTTFDDALHDLRQFDSRAKTAKCTIKEQEDIDYDIESMINTSGEWGGVGFDLSTKEVWLTDKVSIKIEMSWANRARWTFRGFQAHVGLLFWAVGILELPMTEYFAALRFISRVGLEMTINPERWDDVITVWPSAMEALERWTLKCLDNKPRRIPSGDAAPTDPLWIIATDACKTGWGYAAVSRSGEVRLHGERWSYAFYRTHHPTGELRRSTFTEPHGVINSLCHLLKPVPGAARELVIVGTDNIPTRAAYARGYNSVSFSTNNCVERMRLLFNDFFLFEFRYIAGSRNVHADAQSRGTSTSATHGQISQDLRNWAGDEKTEEMEEGAAPSSACILQLEPLDG